MVRLETSKHLKPENMGKYKPTS